MNSAPIWFPFPKTECWQLPTNGFHTKKLKSASRAFPQWPDSRKHRGMSNVSKKLARKLKLVHQQLVHEHLFPHVFHKKMKLKYSASSAVILPTYRRFA